MRLADETCIEILSIEKLEILPFSPANTGLTPLVPTLLEAIKKYSRRPENR
jgi:hypothetical protein